MPSRGWPTIKSSGANSERPGAGWSKMSFPPTESDQKPLRYMIAFWGACRDLRERHRRVDPCAACDGSWAGRRGALSVIHLLRDGGGGGSGRGNGGVCRRRCNDVQHRCQRHCRRGCDSKRSRPHAESDYSGGPVRPAGRPRGGAGCGKRRKPVGSRRRRAGFWCNVQQPALGYVWPGDGDQFFPRQAARLLWRRRRSNDRR